MWHNTLFPPTGADFSRQQSERSAELTAKDIIAGNERTTLQMNNKEQQISAHNVIFPQTVPPNVSQ